MKLSQHRNIREKAKRKKLGLKCRTTGLTYFIIFLKPLFYFSNTSEHRDSGRWATVGVSVVLFKITLYKDPLFYSISVIPG